MKTTKLGQYIIDEAIGWLKYWNANGCRENPDNVIYCNGKKISWIYVKDKEPWCAAAISVIIKSACEKAGVKNKMALSGASRVILNTSQKNGVLVNFTPTPGAVAVRLYLTSEGVESTSGHTMLIVDVTDDFVYTIEGNTSDNFCIRSYPKNTFINGSSTGNYKRHYIIHTELMGLNSEADNPANISELAKLNVSACGPIQTTNDDWQTGGNSNSGNSNSGNSNYSSKRNYFKV